MTNPNNGSHQSGGTAGGLTFSGALQIAFIVLKLTGVIKWSWFWVFAPIWGSVLLITILVIIGIWLHLR